MILPAILVDWDNENSCLQNDYKSIVRDVWDYSVSCSSTIHPDKASELINALGIVLDEWNNEPIEQDGYFFEFIHTPEHGIFKKSEEVVAKLPTINVNFNNTAEDPTGSIIIGEEEIRYLYEFDEFEEVWDFRNLMEDFLSEIDEGFLYLSLNYF